MRQKVIASACFLAALFWGGASARAKNAVVTSRITPNSITLGQGATYSVSIEGKDQPKRLNLPAVKGLELTYRGVSQNMQSTIRNGQLQSTITKSYNFQVSANGTGTFIIPTYLLEIEGRRVSVPAATLTVLPPDGKTNVTVDDLAFLELTPQVKATYVGQMARYTLKLYVLSSLTNVSFIDIQQKGDAFSQSALPKDAETSGARRNDLNYQVFSLPITVVPLKSGTQKIEYDLNIEVTFPSRRRRSSNSFFDNFFNDDFFSFGGLRNRRQLKVSTKEVPLEILPLPEAGKPDNFSGAIGLFSIKQSLSEKEVKAGDPVTLKIEIAGEGNFDRIQPLDLRVGKNWKSYAPKVEFIPKDEQNYQGTKTFSYVLIPQSADIREAPEAGFSFFDPDSREYVDLTPKPMAIKVDPAPPTRTAPRLPVAAIAGNASDLPKTRPKQKTILPIKVLPGPWVPAILPAFRTPLFLTSQLVPLLLLASVYLIRKRQLRLRNDTSFARRLKGEKSMRKWLREAKSRAAAEDAEEFFAAAQHAIQESLGKHFHSRADSLTLPELERFLRERGTEVELIEEMRNFFQAGDAIRFAGTRTEEKSLREWNQSLQKLVDNLMNLK